MSLASRRSFLRSSLALSAAAALPGPAFASSGFYAPLDSVPHDRTWMAWPDSQAIWGQSLPIAQSNIALIARTIAKYEPVTVCANPVSLAAAQRECGPAVSVIGNIPVDDCWMRDSGPIFRVDGLGALDAVGLNFNGWGNRQTHANDARVARRVAAHLGLPFTAASFVAEGGAIETDGRGTLMATSSSIVNPNRNPGRSRDHLAAAMCAAFGACKVIWFPGIAGHDITDDHVDATSRFIAAGAGAVQLPLPAYHDIWSNDERRQDRILSSSTDASGNAIRVVSIQGPDFNLIRQGNNPNFVASYANYYVCNGAVISAQFGDTGADQAARATLAQLFPGRTIEQLNIDGLGAGGGGIHCVTQPQPRP